MQLPSRLSLVTLGDILGALHRASTTGLLELCEIRGPTGDSVPGRKHAIHLRAGLVAAVETELPVPRLGEMLFREGSLSEQDLGALLRQIRLGDFRRSGEILCAGGLADEQAVLKGLRHQLVQRLDAVFEVKNASVSFHTAKALYGPLRCAPLTADDFLHGRPRTRDRGHSQPNRRSPWPGAQTSLPPGLFAIRDDPRTRARQLLQVPTGAAIDDVRRAFRKLAATTHPDRFLSLADDVQRARAADFARLSAAYHLLVA
jgi:hypothetical protein